MGAESWSKGRTIANVWLSLMHCHCGTSWLLCVVLCRLVEQFGSTRRKRQLAQRAEGTVVVTQNAAAAELDVMMQEVQRRAQAAGNTREEVSDTLQ